MNEDRQSFQMRLHRIQSLFSPSEITSILLLSFLIVSILNLIMIPASTSELSFIKSVNVTRTIASLVLNFISLCVIHYFYPKKHVLYYLLNLAAALFGLLIIQDNPKNIYFTMGIITIVGIITYSAFKDGANLEGFRINARWAFLCITVLFVGMTCLLALSTICRHKGFGSSTYDFGIFAQMYEYMKTIGLPLTTVERGPLLSHFAIHFSPIYYLLLPGYLVFSTPEYLLVMQAILICSAVFPLFLICRHFNLNNILIILVSTAYLVFPGVISPAFYDFHENAFLPVIIL